MTITLFLNRWGGEILYNNFEITINDSIGKDRGYKVMFGKNLQSIEEEIDTSSVVTRIRPEGTMAIIWITGTI